MKTLNMQDFNRQEMTDLQDDLSNGDRENIINNKHFKDLPKIELPKHPNDDNLGEFFSESEYFKAVPYGTI
jgi:hypothetical protein